uniref:Uncharacterized protein n=1 Tax=Rhizophora mucronata TaxID=61149 RepID=A0A2P2IHT2_RHIMU
MALTNRVPPLLLPEVKGSNSLLSTLLLICQVILSFLLTKYLSATWTKEH